MIRLPLVTVFLFGAVLITCTGVEDDELIPRPTELGVTVNDDQGNAVAGALVYLYRDRSSMEARLGHVFSDTTDENGMASFTEMEAERYYIYAFHENGQQYFDNSTQTFVLPDALIESSLTNITVNTVPERQIDPDSLVFIGIQYPNGYTEPINDGFYDLQAGLLYSPPMMPGSSTFSGLHVYDGAATRANGINYADSLSLFYSSLKDFYPFVPEAKFTLGLGNEFSAYNLRIFRWDLGILSIQAFNLGTVLEEAMNQDLPYPRRIRIGELETDFDNLSIDLLVEWR